MVQKVWFTCELRLSYHETQNISRNNVTTFKPILVNVLYTLYNYLDMMDRQLILIKGNDNA